jgi:hypothetical protein
MRRRDPSIDSVRLALRMTPEQIAIYSAIEHERRKKADVARETGFSKQRIGQIYNKARAILLESRTPSRELLAKLPRVEAEACAMGGFTTIDGVIEALVANKAPKWWPPPVMIALCKRFDVAVPGRNAAKVAGALMRLAAHNDQGRRLIDDANRALAKYRQEENERLLEELQNENTPSLEAVKRELAPTGS